MQLSTSRALVPVPPPPRRRLLHRLLYGRNIDRGAKARARVGLAIIAFAAVYSVIDPGRVALALMRDPHTRRGIGQEAVATSRPDILDRNGEILATDVKAPSLFADARKIVDVDEAVELLSATLPDIDSGEARERLGSKRGFVWVKRRDTAK